MTHDALTSGLVKELVDAGERLARFKACKYTRAQIGWAKGVVDGLERAIVLVQVLGKAE